MCCCILVCAHYWPRNGRNNVLIGLPDLVKERKLSKIVINRRVPNIFYYISREFSIQNFHITRFYSDGEYCNSFVIAAGDSRKCQSFVWCAAPMRDRFVHVRRRST